MWMKTNGCGRNGVTLLGVEFPADGTPVKTKEFDDSDLRFLAQQNVRPCDAPPPKEPALVADTETIEETTADPVEDEDSIRSRARDAGIRNWWNKSIENIKEELSGD